MLHSDVNDCTDKSSGYQGTGSRFQHTEKLQFAQEDEGGHMEEASEEVSESGQCSVWTHAFSQARFIH